MRWSLAVVCSAILFSGANANEISLRPVLRVAADASAVEDATFQQWVQGFESRAIARGLSPQIVRQAMSSARFDETIIKKDRNQAEFTKTIWDYLGTAVSDARIVNGRAAMERHRTTLAEIEAEFGVEAEIVTAIWGLESAFGAFRGKTPTISALATLAFDGRRAAFFESQLIAALQILDAGDVPISGMNGSWAGAMGHTQFMPTSFLEYAVDFTKDGQRDIWSDDPTDALASTAAYLGRFGWTYGQPWGIEVRLPAGFDYRLADRSVTKTPAEWVGLGISPATGQMIEADWNASILLPAGAAGAAFMVFDNFSVLERYNTADAYVIGVGHLADRLRGGPSIQADWPVEDRALTFDERVELQERLTQAGFDTQKIDGKIGPLTIGAVRRWQVSKDILPDGYASLKLLQTLRGL